MSASSEFTCRLHFSTISHRMEACGRRAVLRELPGRDRLRADRRVAAGLSTPAIGSDQACSEPNLNLPAAAGKIK
jgi:hypothetical protein